MTLGTKPFFRAVSATVSYPMGWLQELLQSIPWPSTMVLFVVLAYAARGTGLAVFTGVALLYMVIIGYWAESMNTLALVFMSIPLAVSAGLLIGIWAYKSQTVDRVVQPTLDLMQTVPTFAYLIPILLLFGFGPVVGLIASAIYACPPMVRNVILGLRRVPHEIIESGLMSGTTRRQLLWRVEVPSAMPTIMIGVNQSVMAALSMVIIAAIIGSSAGHRLGGAEHDAQGGIRRKSAGRYRDRADCDDFRPYQPGLLGTAIAFTRSVRFCLVARRPFAVIALGAALALALLAWFVPPLRDYPGEWSPARWLALRLNGGVDWVTANHHQTLDALKNSFFFYFLLPLRIGFETAIRPHTWGFELTPALITGYALLVAALAVAASGCGAGAQPCP